MFPASDRKQKMCWPYQHSQTCAGTVRYLGAGGLGPPNTRGQVHPACSVPESPGTSGFWYWRAKAEMKISMLWMCMKVNSSKPAHRNFFFFHNFFIWEMSTDALILSSSEAHSPAFRDYTDGAVFCWSPCISILFGNSMLNGSFCRPQTFLFQRHSRLLEV